MKTLGWLGFFVLAFGTIAGAQTPFSTLGDHRADVRSAMSSTADGTNGKCGTAFRMSWRVEHLAGRTGVDGVWDARPGRQVARSSTAGRVRVHYDTAGAHAPALLDAVGGRIPGTAHAYADSVLAAFERAWDGIVGVLKYDAPPADTSGGGSEYDIYVSDLAPDLFGQTVLEALVPGAARNERWRSFIEVDNDFAGLRTRGMAGLRITAVHEFFHAVQVGSYGIWDDSEFYFYELASVWMETVLEPGIEDYLFDLPGYFAAFSGVSLTAITSAHRGYERSIFAMFLDERFDRDVIRDVWTGVREERVVPALDRALRVRGSSLRDAYREFALWNHRTRDRAAGSMTYRNAMRFPRMAVAAAAAWTPPSVRLSSSAQPLSHLTFELRTSADTLSTVVVNADVAAAQLGSFTPGAVAVRIAGSASGSGQRIGDYWWSTDVASADDWFLEVLSAARGDAVPPSTERPWPSPWLLSLDADLVLPLGSLPSPEAVSFVSAANSVTPVERWSVEIQRAMNVARIPVTAMRDRLATGVYVVVLRHGREQALWKVAVIR